MLTLEEMKALPKDQQLALYKKISEVRKSSKATNYSSLYGVGAAKLSRETGLSKKDAQKLLDAYWAKNWAIGKVAEKAEVKCTGKSMWLKNPVSGFWYQLRAEKDKFSTLNQGTGVFCFDTWLYYIRSLGVVIPFQYHDEKASYVPIGQEKEHQELLEEAISKTNDKLKLNVPLGVDVKFGSNYASVH